MFSRKYHYSLRTLFLAVATLALGLAWLARDIGRSRDQAAIVRSITDAGGAVSYDYEQRDDWLEWCGERPSRSLGRWLFGRDFRTKVLSVKWAVGRDTGERPLNLSALRDLEEVSLDIDALGDADLRSIATLDRLVTLRLRGTAILDGPSLAHLTRLGNLRSLNLVGCHLDERGIMHLGRLTALRELSLQGSHLSDAGLGFLNSLTSLESLDLMATGVSDRGCAHLEGLTGLRRLNLSQNRITDQGIRHLATLNRLDYLWLDDTEASDGGLHHLKGLSSVGLLSLDGTKVTDRGLQELRGMSSLSALSVRSTRVSQTGVDLLRRALPALRVYVTEGREKKGIGPTKEQ
jgi:hypothetical protein